MIGILKIITTETKYAYAKFESQIQQNKGKYIKIN